jgi:ferredoxin
MSGAVLARVGEPGGTSTEAVYGRYQVWIDQDLCTGDGICEDYCPEVFVILDDGIAYVHESGIVMNDPGQSEGLARVRPEHEEDVISAASDCPGECIFIETVG